jgi:peptidoglycan hydrolase-like protein with peptidoglycan-binding domain
MRNDNPGKGRRRAARTAGAVAVTGVVAATAVTVGYAMAARPRSDAPAAAAVPTGAAAVVRGTVRERVPVAGTLGFDGGYTVINQLAPGVLTSTAAPGGTVGRGGVLYSVDSRPVRLLYGATPAYRAFTAGMPDGPDVRELEANLAALGLRPGTVDNHFTAATAAAIRRWQAAHGVPAGQRTGALARGEVVILPGALRVTAVPAAVGAQLAPDAPVLSATSTSRAVTIPMTTDQVSLVHVGDQVLVVLPGTGGQVPGRVTRIGRVATAPDATGGGGQSGPATVAVTVSLRVPAGAAGLDQAPVQVEITTAEHRDVLLVPVTALLARPGGGYQVRLASGGYVAVTPGLFDDATGTVEVSGAGLVAGQRVAVPAS